MERVQHKCPVCGQGVNGSPGMQQGGRAMERAQQKCPVCEQSLHGSLANRPIRGQFGLEYDGRRIELCSWTCFCGFFQEPEHYYANYRAETNQVISRLEQILESHARLAER